MGQRNQVAAAAVALLLAACGPGAGEDPGAALSVDEALRTEPRDAVVEGYLFADPAGVRLCDLVAESYPPQCGGASLVVEGMDEADLGDLATEGDHGWSDGPMRLRGTVEGETLTVTGTQP